MTPPHRSRETGRRLKLQHALAVAEKAWNLLLLVLLFVLLVLLALRCRAARREPPLAVDKNAVPCARRQPRRRVSLAQQGIEAQPPHGAALALWLRRRLVAGLLQAQADALQRQRGVEEERDGRGASDVGGVAARDDAHEELRGEVEEAGGRRRAWRGGGGGGGGGEAARAAARRGGHREKKNLSAQRDDCCIYFPSLPWVVCFLSFFLYLFITKIIYRAGTT